MIDVSKYAGFDLSLDPEANQVRSNAGFTSKTVTRMQEDMRPVLRSPDAAQPGTPYYHVFYMDSAPEGGQEALDRLHLTYGPVLLPPGSIAGEFVKTSGHYHPDMPGTNISYPEIYTGLHGRLLLYLQRRDRNAAASPLDCTIVELLPGVTVTVPPDYAHVLINPSPEPALMAGLYGTDFKPDYRDVIVHQGLAWYILQSEHDYAIEANPHYAGAPALNRLSDLSGTIFEAPLDSTRSVWEAFVRDPERFAFLSQGSAAAHHFSRWLP